jgi:hypothetical protein
LEVGIINVGQGAALDVDLELAFHPADETAEPVRRPWTWPLIRPGQRYQFIPPEVAGQRAPDFGLWAAVYPRVTLTGTVRLNSTRNIRWTWLCRTSTHSAPSRWRLDWPATGRPGRPAGEGARQVRRFDQRCSSAYRDSLDSVRSGRGSPSARSPPPHRGGAQTAAFRPKRRFSAGLLPARAWPGTSRVENSQADSSTERRSCWKLRPSKYGYRFRCIAAKAAPSTVRKIVLVCRAQGG